MNLGQTHAKASTFSTILSLCPSQDILKQVSEQLTEEWFPPSFLLEDLPPSKTGAQVVESPFLVWRGDTHQLFLS